jgi:putative ABC transport system permease protein
MPGNHLTTTIRSWRKSPAHNILKVTGLALGIACAALILLWVEDELNWDHQVPDRNRVYMARMNMPFQGMINSFTAGPTNLGPAAAIGIPGIQHFFRYADGERKLFTIGTKTFYENGTYADSGYFDITKIPFLKGSPRGCLRRLHSIVITASTATKYFGDEDPMGKTIRMDTINYTVTGVVPDFTTNTSLGFSWLASFDDWLAIHPQMNVWGNWGRPMVFELEPGVDPNLVEHKLTALIRSKDKGYAQVAMLLWPMKDWHLYDNFTNGKPDGGQIKFVKLFSLIASIILLIACINFMNLATARAKSASAKPSAHCDDPLSAASSPNPCCSPSSLLQSPSCSCTSPFPFSTTLWVKSSPLTRSNPFTWPGLSASASFAACFPAAIRPSISPLSTPSPS